MVSRLWQKERYAAHGCVFPIDVLMRAGALPAVARGHGSAVRRPAIPEPHLTFTFADELIRTRSPIRSKRSSARTLVWDSTFIKGEGRALPSAGTRT